ncbi:DoxX family protein [Sphingomonas abietis]|uniref:DoxX family protein n=1 Tax=Sphingomonas abietis TaxID=3012344 RepID=A0ABY7NPM4_9SPHN|nr:DoxX family protein [Sphingomonas abietis]WBO23487.1 DoxX family protein [Sphingomonas abietis]
MSQSATITASSARPLAAPGTAALPAIGRTAMAAIFLLSGFSKLAAPAATIAYIQSAGLPFPPIAFAAAAATEILGGLALVLGFHARITATIMTLFTLATAFAFHDHLADQSQFINFWKNIAMAGGLLQVVAFGAGAYSLDARR